MEYAILQSERCTAKRECEEWGQKEREVKEARTKSEQRLMEINHELLAHISLPSDVIASIMLLLDDRRDYRSMRLTCKDWDAAYADNEWRFRDKEWTVIQQYIPNGNAILMPRLKPLFELLDALEDERTFRYIYNYKGAFKYVAWETSSFDRIAHCIPDHWIVQAKGKDFHGQIFEIYYSYYLDKRRRLHCTMSKGHKLSVCMKYAKYYMVNMKKLQTRESIVTSMMSPEEFVEEVRLQIVDSPELLDEDSLNTLEKMMVDKANLPLWMRDAAKKWHTEATAK